MAALAMIALNQSAVVRIAQLPRFKARLIVSAGDTIRFKMAGALVRSFPEKPRGKHKGEGLRVPAI
ncbi:MAG TPA: hypothetical protein VGM57_07100 [Pseudolabrys sp.]|jgi:hypothetical protein